MQSSQTLYYWVTLTLLLCASISIFVLLLKRFCFKRRVDPSDGGDLFLGGQRGVDPAVIETFTKFTYSVEGSKRVCRGMNVCVICLAVFKVGETLRSMPRCGHVFHSGCVNSWLKTHSTCPCCRANLARGPDGLGRFFSRFFRPAS